MKKLSYCANFSQETRREKELENKSLSEKKFKQASQLADLLDEAARRWGSPLVARTEIGRFSGGLVSPKSLANHDSSGTGPQRVYLGRKVAYPVDSLVEWLKTLSRAQKREDADI